MKANVFLTVYNTRMKHKNIISKDDILREISDLIKPVQYIPYDDKLKIVDITIKNSLDSQFPTANLHRAFIINMISAYTNLEMDNSGFDVLSESKLIDYIISLFQSEFTICSSLLQMCLDDMKARSG